MKTDILEDYIFDTLYRKDIKGMLLSKIKEGIEIENDEIDIKIRALEEKNFISIFNKKNKEIRIQLTQKGRDKGRIIFREKELKIDTLLAKRLLEKATIQNEFTTTEFEELFKDLNLSFDVNSREGFHRCRKVLSKYRLLKTAIFASTSPDIHRIELTELGREIGENEDFFQYKEKIDRENFEKDNSLVVKKKTITRETVIAIKLLIAENKLSKAIKQTMEVAAKIQDDNLLDQVIIISRMYKEIEQKEKLFLLDDNSINIRKAKVSKALLDILDDIELV